MRRGGSGDPRVLADVCVDEEAAVVVEYPVCLVQHVTKPIARQVFQDVQRDRLRECSVRNRKAPQIADHHVDPLHHLRREMRTDVDSRSDTRPNRAATRGTSRLRTRDRRAGRGARHGATNAAGCSSERRPTARAASRARDGRPRAAIRPDTWSGRRTLRSDAGRRIRRRRFRSYADMHGNHRAVLSNRCDPGSPGSVRNRAADPRSPAEPPRRTAGCGARIVPLRDRVQHGAKYSRPCPSAIVAAHERIDHRGSGLHRLPSGRPPPRRRASGSGARRPVDRDLRQHRTPRIESELHRRPHVDLRRDRPRGASRSLRHRGASRCGGRREADHRRAGAYDRNERRRDGARPATREPERETSVARIHVRGLRQAHVGPVRGRLGPADRTAASQSMGVRLQQGSRRVPGSRLLERAAAAGGDRPSLQHRRAAPDRAATGWSCRPSYGRRWPASR